MSLDLDASAMLAMLRGEPGGEFVDGLLDDADVPVYAHAVNMLEVFYDFARRVGVSEARQVLQDLRRSGIIERTDMDRAFLEDAGALKADHNVALGDSFGLALSRRLDADFVTSDHHELDAVAAAGACRIIFIR